MKHPPPPPPPPLLLSAPLEEPGLASNSTVTVRSEFMVTVLVVDVDVSSSVPVHAFTLYPYSGVAVQLIFVP